MFTDCSLIKLTDLGLASPGSRACDPVRGGMHQCGSDRASSGLWHLQVRRGCPRTGIRVKPHLSELPTGLADVLKGLFGDKLRCKSDRVKVNRHPWRTRGLPMVNMHGLLQTRRWVKNQQFYSSWVAVHLCRSGWEHRTESKIQSSESTRRREVAMTLIICCDETRGRVSPGFLNGSDNHCLSSCNCRRRYSPGCRPFQRLNAR